MDHTGMLATMTVEAATDGDVFLALLERVLCPKLRPGHVVVMDNLSPHKVDGVRERIEACGASVLYLPPYSPNLNPIEKVWSKLKTRLRALPGKNHAAASNRHRTSPPKPSPHKTPMHGSDFALDYT